MHVVRWICLGCAVVDLAPLLAHLLELPNKLTLPAPLWLAVQQNLYSGWGPVLGPFEVGAAVSAWVLVVIALRSGRSPALPLTAALVFTVMLVLFFTVVEPVNRAVAVWTPETLPADWPRYRLRWEIGHAVRTLLAVVALTSIVRVQTREPGRQLP
jgi:hypothetical protein